MYSKWQYGLRYLRYYFSAANGKGHGMHSPFVFDFIVKVLNDKSNYPDYAEVEQLRNQLLHDGRMVAVEDLGAGSRATSLNKRSVRSIAKHALKPRAYGQLLYRIVKYYQPGTILELGTSLGITTAYLAKAHSQGSVTTIEGAPGIAELAAENFRKLSVQPVLKRGNFDVILPSVIRDLNRIDFAFIDGNHRREPTERYFADILSLCNHNSIIILDDIHWSSEMEASWEAIKMHKKVRCTIDLFFIGIVFFREEFHEKQDFLIRF